MLQIKAEKSHAPLNIQISEAYQRHSDVESALFNISLIN